MDSYTSLLKKLLRKHGCIFERQGKGDHEIWYSPITDIRFVVDSKIKSRHTQTDAHGLCSRSECGSISVHPRSSAVCRDHSCLKSYAATKSVRIRNVHMKAIRTWPAKSLTEPLRQKQTQSNMDTEGNDGSSSP